MNITKWILYGLDFTTLQICYCFWATTFCIQSIMTCTPSTFENPLVIFCFSAGFCRIDRILKIALRIENTQHVWDEDWVLKMIIQNTKLNLWKRNFGSVDWDFKPYMKFCIIKLFSIMVFWNEIYYRTANAAWHPLITAKLP